MRIFPRAYICALFLTVMLFTTMQEIKDLHHHEAFNLPQIYFHYISWLYVNQN